MIEPNVYICLTIAVTVLYFLLGIGTARNYRAVYGVHDSLGILIIMWPVLLLVEAFK